MEPLNGKLTYDLKVRREAKRLYYVNSSRERNGIEGLHRRDVTNFVTIEETRRGWGLSPRVSQNKTVTYPAHQHISGISLVFWADNLPGRGTKDAGYWGAQVGLSLAREPIHAGLVLLDKATDSCPIGWTLLGTMSTSHQRWVASEKAPQKEVGQRDTRANMRWAPAWRDVVQCLSQKRRIIWNFLASEIFNKQQQKGQRDSRVDGLLEWFRSLGR